MIPLNLYNRVTISGLNQVLDISDSPDEIETLASDISHCLNKWTTSLQDQFHLQTGFLPMSENCTLCLYLRPDSWSIYKNTLVPSETSHPSLFSVHLDSQSIILFSCRPAGWGHGTYSR